MPTAEGANARVERVTGAEAVEREGTVITAVVDIGSILCCVARENASDKIKCAVIQTNTTPINIPVQGNHILRDDARGHSHHGVWVVDPHAAATIAAGVFRDGAVGHGHGYKVPSDVQAISVALCDGEIVERNLRAVLNEEALHCIVAVHLEVVAVDHHPRESAYADVCCKGDVCRELNLDIISGQCRCEFVEGGHSDRRHASRNDESSSRCWRGQALCSNEPSTRRVRRMGRRG
mmetsp:Transcript_39381/g.77618  ORF Transcript_39381/g.77618 Transcript_39381/m.77618 type:complete len:235 (-) Transcript_39381:727-1431(-)